MIDSLVKDQAIDQCQLFTLQYDLKYTGLQHCIIV